MPIRDHVPAPLPPSSSLLEQATGLRRHGDLADAESACLAILAERPDDAFALRELGVVLKGLDRLDEAILALRRALELMPSLAGARTTLALALFAKGDLAAAWPEYEARWLTDPDCRARKAHFSQTAWRGERLHRNTLAIWGEQGLGDEIQGASMLPDAIARGGACLVECDPRLASLFRRSFPKATIIGRVRPPPLTMIMAEYQVPLTGLGALFRTKLKDFPRRAGYLVPDPTRIRDWKRWLNDLGPGRKVGLSWRGRLVDAERSLHFPPPESLRPIAGIPGAVFVNLQYDSGPEEVEALQDATGQPIHQPPGLDLTNDMDGVAALMAALDAVVSPATAVAMLAGAVGRPTWMFGLFPASNEKEILGCDELPWCRSVRVIRHPVGGDWAPTLGRVAEALATHLMRG